MGGAAAPRVDRRSAQAFRDLLHRAGYTREAIQAAIGGAGDVLSRREERPVALRRIAGSHGPLETLLRLFLLDEPVRENEVGTAIAPTPIDALHSLGIVAEADGWMRGQMRIVPHGDIIITSDLPPERTTTAGSRTGPRAADLVPGLHRPSITLADLTVRRPVDTALDVGTGNGIQALLAARHARHVVATDVNERALAVAALNAAINGCDNIELRAGSFFEPVAGERFGLVVCNPPYVISPEMEYVFRDSGLGRDRVSEQLVGELPDHLDDGGFGTIMASWIQAGDDVTARPRAWLAGRGCDAWILHTAVEDRLTVAAVWNRDEADDEAEYAAAIDRWLSYFAAEKIDAVAYGALLVRRRADATGPNWVRGRELPPEPRTDPAAHVARLFAGVDASVAHGTDDELAGMHLSLVAGATIDTHLRRLRDGWSEAFELTLASGIPFSAELDRLTTELFSGLDGRQPIGDVLRAFATSHDAPIERVQRSGLGLAREVLESGFVEVVPEPAEGS